MIISFDSGERVVAGGEQAGENPLFVVGPWRAPSVRPSVGIRQSDAEALKERTDFEEAAFF